MSSFDAEIAVLSASVGSPTQEALDTGATPYIELAITRGLTLPIPNPETGLPLVIPNGRYRFAFSREQAIEIFEAALRAAVDLPEQPAPSGKVMIAQNMADVDAAAKRIQQATGR